MQDTSSSPVGQPVVGQKRGQRLIAMGLCIVLAFAAGLGVGDGRFHVSPQLKSVQKTAPENLDYSSVEALYDVLRQDYDGQLDANQLLDGLKTGLVNATGDVYTEYMNAKAAKEFNDELKGTFSGIGAELGKDANNNITIIAPIAGYPAERAGLKAKDVIAEIDGQTTADLTIDQAVNKIRGPEGTKVKLTLIRNGSQPIRVEITREKITIPSVESQILEGNIGYLKISRFAGDTAELSQKAADSFRAAGVKGVIVDLRSDPGGLLTAAVDVSSLWLPKGKTILQEKRNEVVINTYPSKGYATLEGIKTVVLINEGSASASEITAGALKDNGAATLIGVKSYGKGSVQKLEDLPGGAVLKVTIARWYTPNGKNINKEGISPDQEVKRTDDDYKNNRDPQKDAALEFLKK